MAERTKNPVASQRSDTYYNYFRLFDCIGTAIASLPKYAFYGIVAWQGSLAIRSLAGKITIADITTKFIAELGKSESGKKVLLVLLPWIVTLLALIYGLVVTIILKRHIRRDAGIRKQLELIIDPQRSTSDLLENGKTNPQDDD
jgi:hypothetical protein